MELKVTLDTAVPSVVVAIGVYVLPAANSSTSLS